MKNNRVLYLDFLRVFAAFAVIAIHICAALWYDTHQVTNWYVITLFNGFTRWCVPIFIMISGAIFLDPNRDITIKKLLSKPIPRLLVALTFWGFVYMLWEARDILANGGFSLGIVQSMILKIIYGPPAPHLWYIYMIIGLYLLTPILRRITQVATKADYLYLFILFVIFGSLTLTSDRITGRHISFVIPELTSFVAYYLLGYYLSTTDIKIKAKYLLAVFVAGCLFVAGSSHVFAAVSNQAYPDLFFDYHYIGIIISSIALFLFIKRAFDKVKPSPSTERVLFVFAEYSFGVYLVQQFFIELYKANPLNVAAFPQLLLVFMLTLGVFIASIATVAVLKKIPLAKTWIT